MKQRRPDSSGGRGRAGYNRLREFSARCRLIRRRLGLPGGVLISAVSGLAGSLEGIKSDSILLLLTTALVPAL